MAFALLLFVALLIVGRAELGIKGIAICIALFSGTAAIIFISGAPPVLMAVAAAVVDIGLIFYIFGVDIPIRPKH